MSAITNIWSQLVQRRLWPVAILLVAALAAVPLALAKQPRAAESAPPVKTADNGENALASEPIVAQASVDEQAKHAKVLGSAKNPFGVPPTDAGSSEPASSSVVNEASASAPSSSDGSSQSSGGSSQSTGGDQAGGATPVAPTTTPAPRTYALYDLTVRFGDATAGSLQRSTLKRLQPLPSAATPVLIYLGVANDGKSAVFLVDHGVAATGDGSCKPTPDTCETIRLRAGETEFFDVKDATGTVTGQYELDLVKIHKGATTSAKRAKASYSGSKAGRRLLAARALRLGPTGYRLNGATGTITRQAPAAYGAVAHASVGIR